MIKQKKLPIGSLNKKGQKVNGISITKFIKKLTHETIHKKETRKKHSFKMTIQEKADIYRSHFPPILAERMASQIDNTYLPDHPDIRDLILEFAEWIDTKEGGGFWNDIDELYKVEPNPSEEQVIELFNKHNIEQ